MNTYTVKSIFGPTLSGEGSYVGVPVMFLRLAGCNRWSGLDKDRVKSFCAFCDTDFRGGDKLTVNDILQRLHEKSTVVRRVVISGGEPALQIDEELLSRMVSAGFEIHLETNGSIALGNLQDWIFHLTMSPKQSLALTKLERCDDLKVLYPLAPGSEVTPEAFAGFPHSRKFLQPVMDYYYEENLKKTLQKLYENPDWRLSLQTHKILGVE